MRHRPWIFLLACAAFGPSLAHAEVAKEEDPSRKSPTVFRFGLSATTGEKEAKAAASSLVTYLKMRLETDVTVVVLPTPRALADALANGDVDMAWMQPLTYVEAHKKSEGIMPLVKMLRHGMAFYRGVLISKATYPAKDPKGIKNASVEWVAPDSAAGFLFPRSKLVSLGLQPEYLFKTEKFGGDHAKVCQDVLDGKVDVGATFADELPNKQLVLNGCIQTIGAAASSKLKILLKSDPIPNDVIAARAGLNMRDLGRVWQAFLVVPKDNPVVRNVFKADGFASVAPHDFDPVEFAAVSAPPVSETAKMDVSPKPEEAKADAPASEAPMPDVAIVDDAKPDAPKADAPATDAPKADAGT